MILADICQETDHSETILGLQDNDILSGSGGDDIVKGYDGDVKFLDMPEMMYCKEIQETIRLIVEDAMTS
jgi:asparagine synthetase B (glutamine-hydrolysing)